MTDPARLNFDQDFTEFGAFEVEFLDLEWLAKFFQNGGSDFHCG
jgi:hypothetical protein